MKIKAMISIGIFTVIFGAAAFSEYRNKIKEVEETDILFPLYVADLEDQVVPFEAREYIRVVKR
ncbi:hypothetical protein ABES25_15075 [Bacillus gobiensis]|uniref:hypothetical protein n=1 Tax=Bacillus gobiensis TaxID=1441095 RepID=UPI003D20B410